MLTLRLHNPWRKVSDAPPRRRKNARVLRIAVYRSAVDDIAAAVVDADAEVDAAERDSVKAAVEDDAW